MAAPRLGCAMALTCLAWFAPGAAATDGGFGQQLRAQGGHRTGEVVVRARAGVSTARFRRVLTEHGLTIGRRIPHTRLFSVRTNGASVAAAIRALEQSSAVASVQPDYVRRAFDTPNDPYFTSAEQYLGTIRAPDAWDVTHGSRLVTIAVVDTGVSPVEDLAKQLLPGRNFIANSSDTRDDTTISHGTMVAGVAAATTDNGVGIAGVGWDTNVLPVKVLSAQGGGTDFQIAAGIVWAADNGAKVINLSFGGKSPGATLCETVDYAIEKGAVVVAAAGNSGNNTPMYPAACPGVVAVSATDTNGDFAYFSTYGPWLSLAAPGIHITSTRNNSYGSESGTSFAAPIVAGVAALVVAQHPGWSPTEVVWKLESSAQDRGPTGLDPYYGYGLLDAFAALGAPVQAAAAPAADALEPNNTDAEATPLSSSAPIKATIAPEGDVDWYATTVPAPGKVTFRVVAPIFDGDFGPNFAPVLQVFDENMNRLATGDSIAFGQGAVAVARVPTRARCYLRVANSVGAQSPGSYSVGVTTVRLRDVRKVLLPT